MQGFSPIPLSLSLPQSFVQYIRKLLIWLCCQRVDYRVKSANSDPKEAAANSRCRISQPLTTGYGECCIIYNGSLASRPEFKILTGFKNWLRQASILLVGGIRSFKNFVQRKSLGVLRSGSILQQYFPAHISIQADTGRHRLVTHDHDRICTTWPFVNTLWSFASNDVCVRQNIYKFTCEFTFVLCAECNIRSFFSIQHTSNESAERLLRVSWSLAIVCKSSRAVFVPCDVVCSDRVLIQLDSYTTRWV